MSSKQKHKERSGKTNTVVAFKSEDKAKHALVGGRLIFTPKNPKPSKFLEDREGGDKFIKAYEERKKKAV